MLHENFIKVQSQYNAQKAGITSAIVIAVLLPIGICGFCLLLKLRQNAADKREDKLERDYYGGTNNAAATSAREPKPIYEPNITNSAPGSSRSSSGRKKKIGRGDSDDRDSGIQTADVKLHDDGRVTTLGKENDRFQQQHTSPKESPRSSLKNGIIKSNGIAPEDVGHHSGSGSRHGSLSGGSRASRQQSKDEFLLDLENDRGENEMVVGNPTFNEVVAQRSPVGKLPNSPSLGSGSSGKASIPRVPIPTGITSSSDSSNLPSSARSSSRSNTKGGVTSVPLQKQAGPTLIGKDKYSADRAPANEKDITSDVSLSPTQSDARYDGVYYTREPLINKPKAEFPTKTMDVDIDLDSYKPHGNKPSAL